LNYIDNIYIHPKNNSNKTIKTFGFKGNFFNEKILNDLYFKLRPLEPNGFVNMDETSHLHFVRILTSRNLSEEEEQIYLDCDNHQAGYIFDSMKKYFAHFRFCDIGRSQRFVNCNGKILTEGDLYSAKFKGRKKDPKGIELINKVFSELNNNK